MSSDVIACKEDSRQFFVIFPGAAGDVLPSRRCLRALNRFSLSAEDTRLPSKEMPSLEYPLSSRKSVLFFPHLKGLLIHAPELS